MPPLQTHVLTRLSHGKCIQAHGLRASSISMRSQCRSCPSQKRPLGALRDILLRPPGDNTLSYWKEPLKPFRVEAVRPAKERQAVTGLQGGLEHVI